MEVEIRQKKDGELFSFSELSRRGLILFTSAGSEHSRSNSPGKSFKTKPNFCFETSEPTSSSSKIFLDLFLSPSCSDVLIVTGPFSKTHPFTFCWTMFSFNAAPSLWNIPAHNTKLMFHSLRQSRFHTASPMCDLTIIHSRTLHGSLSCRRSQYHSRVSPL